MLSDYARLKNKWLLYHLKFTIFREKRSSTMVSTQWKLLKVSMTKPNVRVDMIFKISILHNQRRIIPLFLQLVAYCLWRGKFCSMNLSDQTKSVKCYIWKEAHNSMRDIQTNVILQINIFFWKCVQWQNNARNNSYNSLHQYVYSVVTAVVERHEQSEKSVIFLMKILYTMNHEVLFYSIT